MSQFDFGVKIVRCLATFVLLFAATAASAQPVPDRHFTGPARVCLNRSGFDLRAGETANLRYSGLHSASLIISGPRGRYIWRDGDSWAIPDGGEPTDLLPGRRVDRYRAEGHARYLIYGRPAYSPDRDSPMFWIEREGAARATEDAAFLRRLILWDRGERQTCRRTFLYGFFERDGR